MAFVFGALVIQSAPDVTMAELERPIGPLEHGYFDLDDNWVPDLRPQHLPMEGFGIADDGRPYYQVDRSVGADGGASLWIDGTGLVWLERDV